MNNKMFLLLTCFLLGIVSIQAQQSKYGFRLGLNYSDIDFEDNPVGLINADDDARIGFTAGFFANYSLSNKISIQPELQYSSQGERTQVVNRESINRSNDQSISLDRLNFGALQLPVFLNYQVVNNLSLSVGPQVGILIWEWERRGNYELFLFSVVGGIGYEITDNLGIDLRASFGLTDVVKTNSSSTFEAKGVNHYLQLTLAYSL